MSEFTRATSVNRINTLHPKLIASAMEVYNACVADNIPIHITCGYRSPQEQEIIYKYGRTIPGTVLTMNRAGYSAHNHKLALDFCFYYDGQMKTWVDAQKTDYWKWMWTKTVNRWRAAGWESGFFWDYNWEPGHVQNLLGKTIGEWYIQSK